MKLFCRFMFASATAATILAACPAAAQQQAAGVVAVDRAGEPSASAHLSDEEISQAYIYLLGRLLVTRQQQLDFQEGFKWNQLVHRKPGAVDWPNPNLDVAYSESWLAVDENSCTIVSVPQINGRYYTVQILSGWGETLANINERVFPQKASGDFAVCLKGAKVTLPAGAMRIDLPVKYARLLTRVALGADPDAAVALQHQFKLTVTGTPGLPSVPRTPIFGLEAFPGVEAFDAANLALDSDPDRNAGLEPMQALARRVAAEAKIPAQRERIDKVIRTKAFRDLGEAGKLIGHGTVQDGWARPGVVGEYGIDYLTRTLVNYRGIWANIKPEVLYYRGAADSTGAELNGDNVYTLTFPKDALPARFAKYFWSVIAVDSTRFRVLPNPLKKYLINEQSGLTYGPDGSLTLYFAAEKPANAPEGNWLPTPRGAKYRLTFRYYGPLEGVANGTYYPPALMKVQ
ncbi:DUF1214 domain-containing protein [Paraburkholderia phenoliruptrix]|uniref:DUF1214 domain-containing protein n=1 Tax=Paraburkholderia phenoliruptrix TaxID=252970 RepID=UPI001C6E3366|nr:DUF1214 domain-containing protein [Paraburkholderia phenoliruptrix]MBW9103989.1 DUF1254 domain-containing protein [Paraburkholderia phenoliruptrix]MBW9131115.1 DUF1254 domain-containing protein [Paraburkholderia ginsengiterrae]